MLSACLICLVLLCSGAAAVPADELTADLDHIGRWAGYATSTTFTTVFLPGPTPGTQVRDASTCWLATARAPRAVASHSSSPTRLSLMPRQTALGTVSPTPILVPPTVTVTIGAPTPIVTAVVPAGVQTVTVYQSPNGVTVVVPSPTPAVTIFVYPNGAPAPSPTARPSSNGNGSNAIRGTGTLCLPGDEDERVPGGEKLKTTPANAVTLCLSSGSVSQLMSQTLSLSTSSCSSCPGTCSCSGTLGI